MGFKQVLLKDRIDKKKRGGGSLDPNFNKYYYCNIKAHNYIRQTKDPQSKFNHSPN